MNPLFAHLNICLNILSLAIYECCGGLIDSRIRKAYMLRPAKYSAYGIPD